MAPARPRRARSASRAASRRNVLDGSAAAASGAGSRLGTQPDVEALSAGTVRVESLCRRIGSRCISSAPARLAATSPPAAAAAGVAGGAALRRPVGPDVPRRGRPRRRRRLRRSGCGAALAAGSAVVALVRGRDAARRGARRRPPRSRRSSAGCRPGKLHAADLAADALHQALGAAARADAAVAPSPDRTLVAMSGGVDSAVAALLLARAGREVASRSRSSCGATRTTTPRRPAAAPAPSAPRAPSPTGSACRTSRSTCARSSAPASCSRGSTTTPPA